MTFPINNKISVVCLQCVRLIIIFKNWNRYRNHPLMYFHFRLISSWWWFKYGLGNAVPRDKLVSKLERRGFDGCNSQWIRNWLISHTQRVVVKGSVSKGRAVASHVPGVALGLALFNIFVSNMDSEMNCTLSKTPSSVVQSSFHWSKGILSRGTLAGLRGGPRQTSWSSTMSSARSSTWVGTKWSVRLLPIQTILCFYDSLYITSKIQSRKKLPYQIPSQQTYHLHQCVANSE